MIKKPRGLIEALTMRTKALTQPSPPAPPKSPAPRAKSYHSVSIQPGHHACAQAKELKDHRFLSSEAPKLPLRTCSVAQCECVYLHHEDRRKLKRRARDLGVTVDGYVEEDRRDEQNGRGRRKSDG